MSLVRPLSLVLLITVSPVWALPAAAFDGTDVSRLPTPALVRHGLAYVPEDRRIFADLTVEENLEVGRQPPRSGSAPWTAERLFALFPNLAEMRRRRGGARTSRARSSQMPPRCSVAARTPPPRR